MDRKLQRPMRLYVGKFLKVPPVPSGPVHIEPESTTQLVAVI